MSSIGRIFVVVNLVLSLVLVGAAAAHLQHTGVTQAAYDAQAAEVETLQGQLSQAESDYVARERQLNTEKQRLQEQNDDLEVARANLQRTNDKQSLDNQQLRDDLTKLAARLDSLDSALQATTQRNRELAQQADDLRQEALDAKDARRRAEQKKRDADESLAKLRLGDEDTQERLNAALAELAKVNNLLQVAVSAGFDPTSVVAAPLIEALVVDVDEEYGFVILDKGSRGDVERGFVFSVYRGGDYLGDVRVDEVYDDYSTARIVMTSPEASMRRHDRATTRL